MRNSPPDISRTELSRLIDEWILVEKYRRILKLRLLDGWTYDEIADRVEMSVRQVKNIVYKNEEKVYKHII
ncbi:MAG: sigma-70 family RNA polymerase sigma factor [Ruminococcus sp.]|nr:sigma-70 family RNA polymerase sigma factor [Ruminococcus sp.]